MPIQQLHLVALQPTHWVRTVLATLSVLSAYTLVHLTHLLNGMLVGQVGIPHQTAILIVAVIQSGGLLYAATVFPLLIPFISTVQAIALAFGMAAVVGF